MTQTGFDAARAIRWTGSQALAPDGRRIGDVGGLVVDRQTGRAQWLLLHNRSHGHRCVPLRELVGLQGRVHVPYDHATVLAGPPVPEDGSLSARHEAQLCAIYRIPPTRGAAVASWERRRTTALARVDPDGVVRWDPGPRYEDDRRAPATTASPTPERRRLAAAGPHDLRVLVADPDLTAGQALRAVVDHHPRLVLAGLHRDGPQATSAAIADPPDVAVLAAQMPLLGGVAVRERLHDVLPGLVFVILDEHAEATVTTLDQRTVLAARSIELPHLLRVIEVLAMTQSARTGTGPLAADLISGRPVAPPTPH